jgi:hypothetical protein
MKSFTIWHIPAMVVAFGAVLTMSPACKAQSEIAPDHFDGTEPWAAPQAAQQPAAHKAGAAKVKQTAPAQHAAVASTAHAATAQHASSTQAGSAKMQLAAKRNDSAASSAQPANVAMTEKRWNPPTTNSKQQ